MTVASPVSSFSRSHSQKQRSLDEGHDDFGQPRARPLGARLPGSPHRSVRQLSFDRDEEPPTSVTNQRPQHRRAVSAGDESTQDLYQPLAAPFMPRRNLSIESIAPGLGDSGRLFHGVERGAGYSVNIVGTESSGSLYSVQSGENPPVAGHPRKPPDIYSGVGWP